MKIEKHEWESIKKQTIAGVFKREFTIDKDDYEYQMRLQKMADWLKRHNQLPTSIPVVCAPHNPADSICKEVASGPEPKQVEQDERAEQTGQQEQANQPPQILSPDKQEPVHQTGTKQTNQTDQNDQNDDIPKLDIRMRDIYDRANKRFITQGVMDACDDGSSVQEGHGYQMVCCPAHGDKDASLKVEAIDDTHCLLHCFGGCKFEELISAFKEICGETGDDDGDDGGDGGGNENDERNQNEKNDGDDNASGEVARIINLPVIDGPASNMSNAQTNAGNTSNTIKANPPTPPNQPNPNAEVAYDYTDANGKVLYQTVRRWDSAKNKKTFIHRTLKFDGTYVNKLTVKPVLYQLPKVLKAIQDRKPLVIVEGEKDTQTVTKHYPEVAVTTNSGGAGDGKWLDMYSETIKDAVKIYMIPDNDDAGRKHMEAVATSLRKYGADLYIIRLPGIDEIGIGADVTDWFECGEIEARKIQLRQACKEAQPYKPELASFGIITGDKLNQMETKDHEFIVEDLAPVGLTNLFASEKVGKSVLAMQMGLAVATGKPLFGKLKAQKGRVLYLALEQGRQLNRNRLEMIEPNLEIPATFNLVSAEDGWDTIDKTGLTKLEQYITYYSDVKLIIIDVWQVVAPVAGGNLNAYEKDSKHLKPLHQLAHQKKIAIVIVHHMNKSYTTTDSFEKVSGSRGMLSVPDHLIAMTRPPNDVNGKLMTKSRVGGSVSWALKFNWQGGRLYWEYVGESVEHTQSKERQDIIDILKSTPDPLSVNDIVDILREEKGVFKNRGSVSRLLSKMHHKQQVERNGKGMYSACGGYDARQEPPNPEIAQIVDVVDPDNIFNQSA